MTVKTLIKDPLNLIIVGVAGQGNVVISLLICNTLVEKGYLVTFGQTYPSQQRGGTVINYIRISREMEYSPILPYGYADVILGMEPVETLRMLRQYVNPGTITIVNPRPLYSIDIWGGAAAEYPDLDELLTAIRSLSARTWVVKATEEAQQLGSPILANVLLAGALIGTGALPLDAESLEPALLERFPDQFDANMVALKRGMELVKP
ncbi:MAG TPA: 2-oxoacid:acceptor oxidoreductase family protein [Dehalococcoidales bacterium]